MDQVFSFGQMEISIVVILKMVGNILIDFVFPFSSLSELHYFVYELNCIFPKIPFMVTADMSGLMEIPLLDIGKMVE